MPESTNHTTENTTLPADVVIDNTQLYEAASWHNTKKLEELIANEAANDIDKQNK